MQAKTKILPNPVKTGFGPYHKSAHQSMKYHQIIWSHLKEETQSYP